MRITCPSCESSYDIKAEALGASGRTVRCAECGTKWFESRKVADPESIEPLVKRTQSLVGDLDDQAPDKASAAATIASPPAGTMSADGAAAEPEAPARREGKRALLRKTPRKRGNGTHDGAARDSGLIVIVVLILALGLGTVFRQDLVRAEPGFASLFATIGLPVNVRGLDFEALGSDVEFDNGQPVIVVVGKIRNLTNDQLDVPRLRLGVRNSAGGEVYATSAPPPRSVIGPGDAVPFRTRLTVFPRDGNDIEIRFLDAREARS